MDEDSKRPSEPPGVGDPRAPGITLGDRLNYLFFIVHPQDRSEYTLEDVATGMAERRSVSITPAYLSQLRKGQRTNPSREILEGLADFFGVNPSYFFDEEVAQTVAAELELYAVMRDAEVRRVALRLPDLSPANLRAIDGIIEQFLEQRRESGSKTERRRTRRSAQGSDGATSHDKG